MTLRRSSGAGLSLVALLGKIVLVMLVTYALVEHVVEDALDPFFPIHGSVWEFVVFGVIGGLLTLVVAILPLRRLVEHERSATAAREAELRDEGRRQDFESSLHRAFEMAETEDAAYDVVQRAFALAVPERPVELLLADSSDAHLKRAVAAGREGAGPGCDVVAPHACPAIRRGSTLVFGSSEDLDGCRHLRNREYGACSGVCVPINVAGRSVGVVHAVAAEHEPPDRRSIARLEALANHGGGRLGMLRVMERTTLQAATDPLTGLLNRRTLESKVSGFQARGEPFALAIGDLDHFKRLNDTHGHETGDRALRLFARVLRASVRSEDLVCRFGGEEFVVVLPGRTASEAGSVLARMQAELLLAIGQGNVPGFTVSYGITDSGSAATLEEMLRIADLHLFQAKRDGRDRIVVDGEDVAEAPAAV